MHDRGGDGCPALGEGPEPPRCSRDLRARARGLVLLERQRRFRDCVLDREGAPSGAWIDTDPTATDAADGGGVAPLRGRLEATEEAVLNSLFKAESMTANGRTVNALDLERVRELLKKYGH